MKTFLMILAHLAIFVIGFFAVPIIALLLTK